MDPLVIFGVGVALVGCGAFGTAVQACREILALPRAGVSLGGSSLLGAMLFILVVDVAIVVGGLWITSTAMGGAHG